MEVNWSYWLPGYCFQCFTLLVEVQKRERGRFVQRMEVTTPSDDVDWTFEIINVKMVHMWRNGSYCMYGCQNERCASGWKVLWCGATRVSCRNNKYCDVKYVYNTLYWNNALVSSSTVSQPILQGSYKMSIWIRYSVPSICNILMDFWKRIVYPLSWSEITTQIFNELRTHSYFVKLWFEWEHQDLSYLVYNLQMIHEEWRWPPRYGWLLKSLFVLWMAIAVCCQGVFFAYWVKPN